MKDVNTLRFSIHNPIVHSLALYFLVGMFLTSGLARRCFTLPYIPSELVVQAWRRARGHRMLTWLLARADDSRLGGRNHNARVPAKSIYTRKVCRDLLSCPRLNLDPTLDLRSPAEYWESCMSSHAGNISALVCLKPTSSSLVDVLTCRDRESADYWLRSPYCNNPLIRVEVADPGNGHSAYATTTRM